MPFADIFGRRPLDFGGSFAADSANIGFGLANGAGAAEGFGSGDGMLTQQIQYQYQQPVQRLYEIGTHKTYYVAGRPQGQASAARVLGPRDITLAFYQAYGSACNATGNVLQFSGAAGCLNFDPATGQQTSGATFSGFNLTMTGVLLIGVAGAVRAEDMIVNENLSMMFISLQVQ